MGRADTRLRTRREVLATARRLFVEQGYAATTIRQIADAAAVSVGTVMGSGGKAALLLAVIEESIDRLMPAVEEPQTGSLEEAVWACFMPYLDFYTSHPELARPYAQLLLTSVPPGHPPLTAQASQFEAAVAARIQNRAPGVCDDDARRCAEALFAAYILALVQWASGATTASDAVVGLRCQVWWQLARFHAPGATR